MYVCLKIACNFPKDWVSE